MRKNKIILLIMTLVLICIGLAIPVHNYYNPASERSSYTCQQHQDDTLRLAMIGDSWIFYHYPYNDTLASMIKQKTKKPAIVSAYGLCGKTSKEVYQSIFEDQTMRNIWKKELIIVSCLSASMTLIKKWGLSTTHRVQSTSSDFF